MDLTFSFGLGATEDEAGLLPEMTVARDTMAGCKPTLDRGIGTVADPYQPQYTQHSTQDADDPAVTMVIQHPDTPRRSQL